MLVLAYLCGVCISLNKYISVEELFLLKRKKGFPFVSLRSELKRNETLEAKRSKNIEQNFSSEQAKHMLYGSDFALFRLFLSETGAP
jgi:hypothetical protein